MTCPAASKAIDHFHESPHRFRQRIAAIVEKFSDMQPDLEKERKTMTRLWAKRDAQIGGMIESTMGMYVDLHGIAGRALPKLDNLDTRSLSYSPGTDMHNRRHWRPKNL
ncbi:MAG: DUF2130 domain-containing protein [Blastocatellia bacterium]|nr:DUF2130 domain-containing protein [Blastocatellia bacterium]